MSWRFLFFQYACRKTLADSRPRIKGRFAKTDDSWECCQREIHNPPFSLLFFKATTTNCLTHKCFNSFKGLLHDNGGEGKGFLQINAWRSFVILWCWLMSRLSSCRKIKDSQPTVGSNMNIRKVWGFINLKFHREQQTYTFLKFYWLLGETLQK